jgi:hypothetical protein
MSQASKVATSVCGPALLGLFVSFSATGYLGCKKDEPPPPLPTATTPAVVAAPPATTVELVPDVAPSAAPAESVKKPTGGGAPAQSFAKCCSALLQNAASAPEPNKTYLTTAANACSSMVKAGQGGPSVVTAVQGLLRGVGMPTACL